MSELYYFSTFILSVLLTGLYMFIWHRHFDVHITLVFVLVPIVNLGFWLLSRSQGLEEALLAHKITYLGGCFLQLMVLLTVFSLCGLSMNRLVKTGLLALSNVVFFLSLSQGEQSDFYTSVSFLRKNNLSILQREYGYLHHIFVAMVILYFAASMIAIIYTFCRKNQVSRIILFFLFLPEIISMFCYFGGRILIPDLDLMPAAYLLAQIMYLMIVHRIGLYDITDTAVDSLMRSGKTGFIHFDFRYRYLGSNEAAKELFPELNLMTVDFPLKKNTDIAGLLLPWIRSFEKNETDHRQNHEIGDKIYLFDLSWLYNGRKKKGYEMVITDNTQDQNYIRLLNQFNSDLQTQVDKATVHIIEMHDQLILGMATMVESRDNSTGGHIRRTSEGVRILIDEMKKNPDCPLEDDFCKKLIKAAPMHDLGKISVDDAILRKPGRFSPEEYEIMKTHAPEGARIVHEILKNTDDTEFQRIAENVAHYHHERWDGKGYPDGLQGEEIPLEARIMAIADVYDALVSKRVYKEKMSFEKANSIILEGMGSQFDPNLESAYRRARPRLEAYYRSVA